MEEHCTTSEQVFGLVGVVLLDWARLRNNRMSDDWDDDDYDDEDDELLGPTGPAPAQPASAIQPPCSWTIRSTR